MDNTPNSTNNPVVQGPTVPQTSGSTGSIQYQNTSKPGNNKKWLWIGLLGCGLPLLLCAVCGGIATITLNNPEFKQELNKAVEEAEKQQNQQNNNENNNIEKKNYNLNQTITVDDKEMVVYSAQEHKSSNQFMQPKSGNKYMAVELSIANKGNEAINVNPMDFKLQDSNGYSYNSTFTADKTPELNAGSVQAGRNVRGFITFEVPTNAQGSELLYTPDIFSNQQIIVKL